jgi:hypothetical protein
MRDLLTLVTQSEDAQEGIAAFLEKRSPGGEANADFANGGRREPDACDAIRDFEVRGQSPAVDPRRNRPDPPGSEEGRARS